MSSDPNNYYRRVSDIVKQTRSELPPAHLRKPGASGARIKRIAWFATLSLLFLAGLFYAGDYVVARYRLAHGRGLGTVDVDLIYAIPQKGKRIEFRYAGTEHRTCVRSVFPHSGYPPCWYVKRHREQRTDF